jgi:hypothetical protein
MNIDDGDDPKFREYGSNWKRGLKRFDGSIQKKIRDFCIGTPEGFIPPQDLDFNKLSIE